ncbi:MAG: hypothetical protein ACFE95_10295 [Candidatus Hodarchaeota archaeon]
MSESNEEFDLELTERLVELTKFVEKNSSIIEEIKSELSREDPIIEKWNKKLGDWELGLDKRFEEINKRFTKINDETGRISPEIERLNEFINKQDTLLTTLEETVNNQAQEITSCEETISNLAQQISSLDELVNNQAQQISDLIEVLNKQEETISSHNQTLEAHNTEINSRVLVTQFETTLTKAVEELEEKLATGFNEHAEKTQIQINGITKTLDIVGKGLEQLDSTSKKQASALEDQRSSLGQFKYKLKELISLTKEDQKTHFENFSRLLESYNENIRTEMSLIAQTMKKSDIEILNEVSNHYTRKKVGENLKQKINDLAKELELEAKKTREELVLSLEKTVKEYEMIMEEQTTRIKKQQQELEQFQDEIQAVIDRKVNEKYELVFSLLSKVSMHAEELALFMKTNEIQIPRSLTDTATEATKEIPTNNKEQTDEPIETESTEEIPINDEESTTDFLSSNDIINETTDPDSHDNSDE